MSRIQPTVRPQREWPSSPRRSFYVFDKANQNAKGKMPLTKNVIEAPRAAKTARVKEIAISINDEIVFTYAKSMQILDIFSSSHARTLACLTHKFSLTRSLESFVV